MPVVKLGDLMLAYGVDEATRSSVPGYVVRNGLSIRPATLHGGTFRTYADHRMAHAGVIVGLAVEGVEVEDVATTAKTFPGFADTWAGLF